MNVSDDWRYGDTPEWLRAALEDRGDPSQVAFATSALIVLHLRILRERARDPSGTSVVAERLGPSTEAAIADLYAWVADALDGVGDISERRNTLARAVATEIEDPSFSRVPDLRRELAMALTSDITTPDTQREMAHRLADVLRLADGRFSAERPDRMGFSMLPPWHQRSG